MSASCHFRRQSGLSLVEVVVTIVVLGIGLAGLLTLYNQLTRASVDPIVRKQALAIASSLLEEVELKAFTYCDPDDANVLTATSTAGCTSAAHVDGMGPDTTPPSVTAETRDAEPRFDHVNDYNGFAMGSGVAAPNHQIKTVSATVVPELADYSASVTVAATADLAPVGANDELKINVVVTHVPSGTTVRLQGYRLRYAPRTP